MSNTTSTVSREEWLKIAYDANPPDVPDDTRKLLEDYSKIPPGEVVSHIVDVRERAFKLYPYPCLGHWRFLHMAIGRHPLYPEVLERMRRGDENLIDLGCAFAQDIRRLVADGVDSSKCYGSDLRLEFLNLGYELFRDKETLQTRFIEADIFEEDNSLAELNGKIDIINASSFFHLFSWDEQMQIARRCVKLLTGRKDNLIIGRQMGTEVAGTSPMPGRQVAAYRHSIESWDRFWQEVGKETNVNFVVKTEFGERRSDIEVLALEKGTRIMTYSVRRIG